MPVKLGSKLVAEFVGTLLFVFVGVMACSLLGRFDPVNVVLAHGLALSIMITATAAISGGHLNPAVTIAFLVTGKIKPAEAILYIAAQLAGAVVASLLVMAIFNGQMGAPGSTTDGYTAVFNGIPNYHDKVSVASAFLAEAIGTFALTFAVWGTAVDPRAPKIGGFGIGLTLAGVITAIGPLTGSSINPARSFGPTIIAAMSGKWPYLLGEHWLYWAAPITGAVAAAVLYKTFLYPSSEKS
jgi:MIP family channel proteins